ncbi:MAG: glgB [Citricoccus sp.]|nr:glgB [Citricoccus sp. WCRC_4]
MTTEQNSSASFPQLLSAWLPSQRWFPVRGSFDLHRVGGIGSGTTFTIHLPLVSDP